MKNLLLVLFVLSTFCGCATSSIPTKEALVVPADRIFRTEKLPIDGNARASFVRDTGFTGSGVYQNLFINGKKAAALNPGEKVEFLLVPGEYIFGAIPTDPFGTHALNTIDQDIKAGRNYFYRIQTDGNSFRTSIQRYLPEAE
ncbi:MAG: hypothetical protein V4573_08970 [Pseudomonadota bacterium]